MTEHVSDMFVHVNFPASELVEAAEKGDHLQVERNMTTFLQHARSLEKASNCLQYTKLCAPLKHLLCILSDYNRLSLLRALPDVEYM